MDQPIVALESTVITHGLPHPHNLELARSMEQIIRDQGARPATIAILDGILRVGISDAELERLAGLKDVRKVSRRDLAAVMVQKASGGTTVAGTLFAAHRAGIRVFATGGIGGVHEVVALDVSADLQALADTPLIVVCAGAKAILDLPATIEMLETLSVPVIGYQTGEFPAFYSRHSGLPVSLQLNSPAEIVQFASTHWELGMRSAVLVCQPLPPQEEIPAEQIQAAIRQARQEAHQQGIHGQPLTPFLLTRLSELTNGDSLRANLALLRNNAILAAQIACAFQSASRNKPI